MNKKGFLLALAFIVAFITLLDVFVLRMLIGQSLAPTLPNQAGILIDAIFLLASIITILFVMDLSFLKRAGFLAALIGSLSFAYIKIVSIPFMHDKKRIADAVQEMKFATQALNARFEEQNNLSEESKTGITKYYDEMNTIRRRIEASWSAFGKAGNKVFKSFNSATYKALFCYEENNERYVKALYATAFHYPDAKKESRGSRQYQNGRSVRTAKGLGIQ